jgi:ketosteroid isomerase-like protein
MPDTTNIALIDRFYRALQQRDGETMAACYRADATFRDPIFELHGARIGAMWKMLTSRGTDLRVEYGNVSADDDAGHADCQAWYTFSATGRHVHNVIHSTFRFGDGLIAAQVDEFDFWRWSRQALGPAGLLLGWSPLLRRKVQAQALRALERFGAS